MWRLGPGFFIIVCSLSSVCVLGASPACIALSLVAVERLRARGDRGEHGPSLGSFLGGPRFLSALSDITLITAVIPGWKTE